MPVTTRIVSIHPFRRTARARERTLQGALNLGGPEAVHRLGMQTGYTAATEWPSWGRGVRVEKAGMFQWAVVATQERGH